MDDVVAFLSGDIPLFVLRADELQPIISVPVGILFNEFPPFRSVVRADRLIARLLRNNGIGIMNVRVNKLSRLRTGRTYPAGVRFAPIGPLAYDVLGKCQ